MKVVIARKISSSSGGVTESVSTQITRVEASNIAETTDLDGDKCYSVTYEVSGTTTTDSFKQKNYVIGVMEG